MAKSVKKCRVCGKEFEPCRSAKVNGTFNWKEVACSPECGAKYLERVNEARGVFVKRATPAKTEIKKSKKESSTECMADNAALPFVSAAEAIEM